MLAKPVLKLDHTAIEHRDRARCFLSHDAALDEERDDLAHAPHVVAGDVPPTTEATTAMPREPSDDAFVNLGDRDLDQRQPVRKVAGYTLIALTVRGVCPVSNRWFVNSTTHGA